MSDYTATRTIKFVSYLFWWSLIMTGGTPLARYVFSDQWYAVSPIVVIFPAYKGVAGTLSKNKAFGLHALIAIAWTIMAYIQICLIPNQFTFAHRMFGRLTTVVFIAHAMGAINILVEDVEGHTLLNKLSLLASLLSTSYQFATAIKKAVADKNYNEHRLWMARTFLSSLDGAGTIRTVAAIQMMFGYGPIMCQCEHGKVGGNCDWTYTWRLLWIIVLRQAIWAIFAMYEDSSLIDEAWNSFTTFYVPMYCVLIGCYMFGFDQAETLYVVASAVIGMISVL